MATISSINIKIGHLNMNTVVNKIDEVKELLNRNMFDILFLAETKIDSTVSSRLVSHPGLFPEKNKGIRAYVKISARNVIFSIPYHSCRKYV